MDPPLRLFTCHDDDDGAGADEGRGQEKYLVDTEQVGHVMIQGADQVPLLDKQDDVSESRCDPAPSLFVEFLKLLGAVRLVL
jgi:hypothetical protein